MEEGTRDLGKLSQLAGHMRRTIVEITTKAGSGHPSTSLSMVELLLPLYFGGVLRHDPLNPRWPDRDRFILSKGHGAPALYTVLAMRGYFPEADLSTLRVIGSALEGHPNMLRVPGVEASTGSLGQGLSFANGLALAARIKGESYHVYCLMGDGETHEGQVWEAARSAVQQRLGNLTAIIDRNRLKAMDRSYQADDLAALPDKWQAFGWRVVQVDGHDMSALVHALDWARTQSRGPALIIAETIKGKGVSFMEDQPAYHNAALTATQFEAALQELDRALAGLEDQA